MPASKGPVGGQGRSGRIGQGFQLTFPPIGFVCRQFRIERSQHFSGQAGNFALRGQLQGAGNMPDGCFIIGRMVTFQPFVDGLLGHMQTDYGFIQQFADDRSLFMGGQGDEADVCDFLDRFAQQLDVRVQNRLDFQQFLRQSQ